MNHLLSEQTARAQTETFFFFISLVFFQPPLPLALPNFKGCIELDTLNEDVLSLYNFENIFQLNTTLDKPCGRSGDTPSLHSFHFNQCWIFSFFIYFL